jgi:hypothetical protein
VWIETKRRYQIGSRLLPPDKIRGFPHTARGISYDGDYLVAVAAFGLDRSAAVPRKVENPFVAHRAFYYLFHNNSSQSVIPDIYVLMRKHLSHRFHCVIDNCCVVSFGADVLVTLYNTHRVSIIETCVRYARKVARFGSKCPNPALNHRGHIISAIRSVVENPVGGVFYTFSSK